eukprot:maker-scaffold_19-snap-gene-4.44-mRNA-1 protein AED:0.04 eAED:0.04 QI:85/1/1/1/0.75/0.6/5/20/420
MENSERRMNEEEKNEMENQTEVLENTAMEDDTEQINEEDLEVVSFGSKDNEPQEIEESEEKTPEKENPNLMFTFSNHNEPVYSISYNPKFSQIASSGGDDLVKIWKPTEDQILTLEGHKDSVTFVEFNFDHTFLASSSLDSTVRIYSVKEEYKLILELNGPSAEIEWLSWHPKGNVIAAGSDDATSWLWEIPSGNCLAVLVGHEKGIISGSFTPNGKKILTGGKDGQIKLFSPGLNAENLLSHTFHGHQWHESPVLSLEFFKCNETSPHKGVFASGGADGRIVLAKLYTKKLFWSNFHSNSGAEGEHGVECLVFSGENLLLSGSSDGTIVIWNFINQQRRFVVNISSVVIRLKKVPDSHFFVFGSSNGDIGLLDSKTGQVVKHIGSHQDMVLDLEIHREENSVLIFTASEDKTCKIFKID